MRLIPRRRPRTFPGIELRISTINGPLVLADSAHLYYSARYGGCAGPDGWFNLVAGVPAEGELGLGLGALGPLGGEFSVVPLKIEIRPVLLAGR